MKYGRQAEGRLRPEIVRLNKGQNITLTIKKHFQISSRLRFQKIACDMFCYNNLYTQCIE